MGLPLSAVEVVLGSKGLQVNSEDVVFDFILQWARTHYPKLEERREILTDRLARFICFPNLSCSKLKSNLGCPDFDLSKLVVNALSSKLEAPYGKHLVCTSFLRRVYKHRLIKVVPLEFARPRCVVFLDLNKQECADLFPSKPLYSQAFCLGGQRLRLNAQCRQANPTFALYVATTAASTGWGFRDLFIKPWIDFMSDDSEYFIDGILHLRADLTLVG